MAKPVTATATSSSAFEQLLTPLLQPAYGIAVHMTRNAADAEDMVQEAALLAFRHFDRFEPGTNFRAWFFKIVINCCRARYRKQRRRPETIDLDDVAELYLFSRTAEAGLHAEGQDTAAKVLAKMDSEQVAAALQALPEEYREAATLYFVQDMSYQDIADTLGCPVGTVRSRLHRGRRMLQKALWDVAQEHGIVGQLVAETHAHGAR